METLTFSRNEFLAKMREYSKSKQGKEYPVQSNTWREMKRMLVENEDIWEVTVESNSIRLRGFRTHLSFSDIVCTNLDKFIYYLRSTDNMATHNFCNCVSDTASALNTLATSISNLPPLGVKNDYADVAVSSVIKPFDYITTVNTTDWLCGTTNDLDSRITSLEKTVNDMTKKKEKKDMNTMFNFDFGKVTSDAVRVSMYGIAVKSVDGRYVSYDVKSHSVMDVDIVNMPAGDFLYKMPVAIKDVKAGDVVIHNKTAMFVAEVHDSTLKVVDIREGTEKEIYLTKSPFGFNFATKVVSLMDMSGAKADESNPFGNMLPFLMLGDGKSVDPMMIMLASGGKMDMSNPMMLYFLMKDGNKNDVLPFMLMGMNSGSLAPASK
ncbi:MAG: hypothetical protein E7270_01840 [Lachnospiraceae bacterium]|nr:hypothetical protein [Lachnospiraceae bacterium]